ncbi:hypothetical protein BgiMline_010707, partial [Biomphalaria glabrata]
MRSFPLFPSLDYYDPMPITLVHSPVQQEDRERADSQQLPPRQHLKQPPDAPENFRVHPGADG